MRVYQFIKAPFMFYLLTKGDAEKDPPKSKQSNNLRIANNEYSQNLTFEDRTRKTGPQKDRKTREKLNFQERQLGASERGKIKNVTDVVLHSQSVQNLGVINGIIVEENRYEYMVRLTDPYGNHICGGSLITNNLVLTAAHCGSYFSKAQIGRYDTADNSEKYEEFDVIGEIVHPEYDSKYLWNDFMIIALSGKSNFQTVTLHNKNKDISPDLTVFGWGVTDPNGSPYKGPLLETNLNYISNPRCMLSTGIVDGMYGSYSELIKDSNMCADSDSSDACYGDSGGPLIIKGATSDDDIQVGVVSWGFGCNHPDFPGVYARVENQIEWIQKVVCILASDDIPSTFVCQQRQEKSHDRSSTSCHPKRGCDEGFTCIHEICVKDKDRNDRSPQTTRLSDPQRTSKGVVP